jgi:two-component system, NarL family, response regulator NreC
MAHLRLAPSSTQSEARPRAGEAIRVVLADGHARIRRSLRLLLDREEEIEVIAEAGDLASVVRDVRRHQPDVLVLDLTMPDGSSVDTIGALRAGVPRTQTVVLTMQESPVFARQALAAGALGYVLKELADSELPDSVRRAACGAQYISPGVRVRLDALQCSLTGDRLTSREAEVLTLIALGHTSVEIARRLDLSPRTVETHRARMYNRLGLRTRAELVRYALGCGLLRT